MKIIDILPSRLSSLVYHLFASNKWHELRCFLSSFSNRWITVIWVCVVTIPPIILVADIVSINQDIAKPVDPASTNSLKYSLERRLEEDSSVDLLVGTQQVYSSLVSQLSIKVTAKRGYGERNQYQYENFVTYRYDIIIVFTGLWLVLLYAIRTLGSKKTDFPLSDEQKENVTNAETTIKSQCLEFSISDATDNIAVLKDEVFFARLRAKDIHQRSSIMLLAGIVMAFVGVGAFYASITSVKPDTKLEAYLMESLRPTAMLVFVEALAWFLLRQYRSLSEEYRRFHQLAQRRADFLTAFMTLSKTNSPDADVLVLTALLQEPSTLILKKGESTESLEENKMASSNPIFDLANSVLQRIPLPIAKNAGNKGTASIE